MRKQLYEALKNRLRLLIIDEDVIKFITEDDYITLEESGTTINNAITHFGLWNRQAEFAEEETPFSVPNVFREIGKSVWNHQRSGLQDAEEPIILHVLTNWISEGYSGDMMHLELLEAINLCLYDFSVGDWMGTMQRVSSTPCHDHEEIVDDVEVFKAMCYDTSACRKTLKIKRDTDISISPQTQKG